MTGYSYLTGKVRLADHPEFGSVFLLTRALVGADSLRFSGLTLRLPFSSCARLRPCCELPVLLEQSPLSGRGPFPVVESSEEGIGVFVA